MLKYTFPAIAALMLTCCVGYAPLAIDLNRDTAEWRELSQNLCRGGALSRADACRIGLLLNPDLNRARLTYARSTEAAKYAGLWDDPSLSGSLERVLQGGFFNHGIAPSLSIPVTGTKSLARQVAEQYREADYWQMRDKERVFLAELNALCNEVLVTHAKLELMRGRLAQARDEQRRVEKLQSLGEVPFADMQVVNTRLSDLVKDEQELSNRHLEVHQRLTRMLGLHPAAGEVELAAELPPSLPQKASAPTAELLLSHPALLAEQANLGAGELELKAEIRRQFPDVSLEPEYRREDEANRIGLGLSFTLPVWNRNRAAIHSAQADRALACQKLVATWRGLLQDASDLAAQQELAYTHCREEQARIDALAGAEARQEQLCSMGETAFPALAEARQEIYTRRLNYLDCLGKLLDIRVKLQSLNPTSFQQ